MPNQTTHVIISGRVQGVFYRDWTVTNALTLGLNGWVRNINDGTVEAVFSGNTTTIEEMINRCYAGPPEAKVIDIQQKLFSDPLEPGFTRKPNA